MILNSGQEEAIRVACRNLKLKSEFSQPRVPKNNALIERTVGDILEGARTLLRTAELSVTCLALGFQVLLFSGERRARGFGWRALVPDARLPF